MKMIFNGALLDSADPQVQVSPLSDAVQFGQSVFETFRTNNGHLPGTLQQHYERLWESAKIIGMELPPTLNQKSLDQGLSNLLSTLDLSQDYCIKILVSEDFWWIKAEKLVLPPAKVYTTGVKIDDVVQHRIFAQAKVASPLYPYYMAQGAEEVFETIFFTTDNYLLEGNISNLIAVIDGQLLSPNKDVLPGITVREVFKQAQSLGINTEFASITRTQLSSATEIFLTSSVKGLVPVQRWGNWERSSSTIFDQLNKVAI